MSYICLSLSNLLYLVYNFKSTNGIIYSFFYDWVIFHRIYTISSFFIHLLVDSFAKNQEDVKTSSKILPSLRASDTAFSMAKAGEKSQKTLKPTPRCSGDLVLSIGVPEPSCVFTLKKAFWAPESKRPNYPTYLPPNREKIWARWGQLGWIFSHGC